MEISCFLLQIALQLFKQRPQLRLQLQPPRTRLRPPLRQQQQQCLVNVIQAMYQVSH